MAGGAKEKRNWGILWRAFVVAMTIIFVILFAIAVILSVSRGRCQGAQSLSSSSSEWISPSWNGYT